MGHAVHFLTRLERLELPEVELALSLYRDTALLREVLNWARIPEGHARVAIGLRREEGGPHLLVTRGGAFVTCLGPGMGVGELPVIGRARFDGLVARVERLRERMAIANALETPGDNTRDLIGRLAQAGHSLSREVFLGASAFVPLLGGHLLKLMLDYADTCRDAWPALSRSAARLGRKFIRRKPEDLLTLWRSLWAPGHLAALLSEHIRDLDARFAEHWGEPLPNLTTPLVHAGFLPTIVRGMLLPAQLGKSALPHYKRLYRDCQIKGELIEGAAGLVVIGRQHAALRAQALKTLKRGPRLRTSSGVSLKDTCQQFSRQIEEPDLVIRQAVVAGRSYWNRWTAGFPAQSIFRLENLSDAAAFWLMTLVCRDLPLLLAADLASSCVVVPTVTIARPQDFYLPAEAVEILERERGGDWALEQTMGLLESYRKLYPEAPARAGQGPGPNERCPCGSGKKFKRCCMDAAA